MSIKICDAIMGSGKSSAAIQYMNDHPNQKFIYISSFLDEAARIRLACPRLNFQEPRKDIPKYNFRKIIHSQQLISDGENIASTHQMFTRYADDLIENIKKWEYVLIIDETVDVLYPSDISIEDLNILEKSECVMREGNFISKSPDFEYRRGNFRQFFDIAKGKQLIEIEETKSNSSVFYWLFSKELLLAFKDVYVLTYMFDCQIMKYGFDLMGVEFEKIGIKLDENGAYQFCDHTEYIPDYTLHLSQKIHIFDNKKINCIGEDYYALSHHWYSKAEKNGDIKTLKNHMSNFFKHYNKDKNAERRLWATFKDCVGILRSEGFYRNFIAFNERATNKYRNRDVLAYCVNVFMNPNEKKFLSQQGIDIRENEYALSVMLQWIWRSAIRDGKEIWIYIPSKRMRNLLLEWIASVEGRNVSVCTEYNVKPVLDTSKQDTKKRRRRSKIKIRSLK